MRLPSIISVLLVLTVLFLGDVVTGNEVEEGATPADAENERGEQSSGPCSCDEQVAAAVSSANAEEDQVNAEVIELQGKVKVAEEELTKCGDELLALGKTVVAEEAELRSQIVDLTETKLTLEEEASKAGTLATQLEAVLADLEAHKLDMKAKQDVFTKQLESQKAELNDAHLLLKKHKEDLAKAQAEYQELDLKHKGKFINIAQIQQDVGGFFQKVFSGGGKNNKNKEQKDQDDDEL